MLASVFVVGCCSVRSLHKSQNWWSCQKKRDWPWRWVWCALPWLWRRQSVRWRWISWRAAPRETPRPWNRVNGGSGNRNSISLLTSLQLNKLAKLGGSLLIYFGLHHGSQHLTSDPLYDFKFFVCRHMHILSPSESHSNSLDELRRGGKGGVKRGYRAAFCQLPSLDTACDISQLLNAISNTLDHIW